MSGLVLFNTQQPSNNACAIPMILIPRLTFSIQSQSSQWCGSLVWLASLHLGCRNDFLDQTFLSHAHTSIISVFHSDAKMFGEVTFHLQVKSFVSKFLDQFVDAFFIWGSHSGIICMWDDEHTGLMEQAFVGGTFSEPQFQWHFAQMQTLVLGANFDLQSDCVIFKHLSLPCLFTKPLGVHVNVGLSNGA